MSARKEWMLGIPGHNELVSLDQVLLLLRGGQLRPTDLVKKLGEPWRAKLPHPSAARNCSNMTSKKNVDANARPT